MTIDATNPHKARFGPKDGDKHKIKGEPILVDFNPTSLQYSITNKLDEKNKESDKARQHVSQSTGKLSLELIFDTTDTGQDVRNKTERVVAMMKPDESKAPPIMRFEWGAFIFNGMVESYQETIDFFAPAGVPLRATVALSLASQENVFELERGTPGAADAAPDALDVPGGGAAETANRGGDPGAARALGAVNNQESLRFPSGAALTVDASVQLGGPVTFSAGASGGAGLGVDIGGGISEGIGGGLSAGASLGGGIEAGFEPPSAEFDLGSALSAGVSADAGAFSGLRSSAKVTPPRLDTGKLLDVEVGGGLASDAGATFGISGAAGISGSAGLSADVGADASLKAFIEFDE